MYETEYRQVITIEDTGYNNTLAPYDTCTNANNAIGSIGGTMANPVTQVHRRPFESVAENLMKLGTLALEHFLHSPSVDPPAPHPSIFTNIPTHALLPQSSSAAQEGKTTAVAPIMLLHQVCSQTFGNLDPLKYEILAESPQTSEHGSY